MFVFLAIFIVFLLYINFLMHKNKRAQENLEKQFWDRERSANFTRKKDISNLNYLIITEDKIPQNLTTDAKKSLETLCGQKMLNLSSMSNTDLKLEYGVAIYAQELSDAGYTDQARQLLEFAVSCHVDNSSIYTQLAAIYQTGDNLSGILQLQEAAAQLAPFPQKIILEKLKSFQP